MLIRTWRLMTLVLTALLMGMTFCHVLELPAKMQYDAALYLTLHRTLYVAFGWPNIGAFIELHPSASSSDLGRAAGTGIPAAVEDRKRSDNTVPRYHQAQASGQSLTS